MLSCRQDKKILLFVFWALIAWFGSHSALATAEIYKSVDKDGKVTYTNAPSEGTKSEVIEVKKPLILPPTPHVYLPSDNRNNQYETSYEINIVRPSSGTQLSPEERSLTIEVSINFGLQSGYEIVYKLDSEKFASGTELQYVFNEPPRGEHQLTAEVVDEKGRVLAQSASVTVLVIRPLVKNKLTTPKAKK